MAKKTTDKKPADKKDAGKKSNAGKDDDESKVLTPSCPGLCWSQFDGCDVGETQGRNLDKRSTHPLRGRTLSQEATLVAPDNISQKHSKATEALTKIQVCAVIASRTHN